MASAAVAERVLTADDFLSHPEDPDGRKLELRDGRVVAVSQPGVEHGIVSSNAFLALRPFVLAHRLGRVGFDTGFKLRASPDRVVNPDVFFANQAVVASILDIRKATPAAPTLAVEVSSPNDVEAEVQAKVGEYIAAGSARVWVVRPAARTVTVFRAGA